MVYLVPVALLAVLLAAHLTVCAVIYRMLFVPPRPSHVDDYVFTPWEFQVDYEEVDLVTADSVNFPVWFLRQSGSRQTIVVSAGHKATRHATLGISMALWRKGFNVLIYSYRGTPGADRRAISMGVKEVNELQATIAFARRKIKDSRIGLLGYSMGAVVSMLGAAGEPSVEALVLDSPYSDLTQLLNENLRRRLLLPGPSFTAVVAFMLRRRTGARISDSSPIAVLGALEPRPLFLIHGGADEVTSVQHSRRLYDGYRGPREIWIVQGAPHVGAYFADRTLYVERVAGFFARHLGLSGRNGQLRLVDEEDAVS